MRKQRVLSKVQPGQKGQTGQRGEKGHNVYIATGNHVLVIATAIVNFRP